MLITNTSKNGASSFATILVRRNALGRSHAEVKVLKQPGKTKEIKKTVIRKYTVFSIFKAQPLAHCQTSLKSL
ncbi:MAG: hypothetical protein ACI9LU_000183 [Polaribacter sp.]|jgi:hypothetical protein